jgi:hypothetical protein
MVVAAAVPGDFTVVVGLDVTVVVQVDAVRDNVILVLLNAGRVAAARADVRGRLFEHAQEVALMLDLFFLLRAVFAPRNVEAAAALRTVKVLVVHLQRVGVHGISDEHEGVIFLVEASFVDVFAMMEVVVAKLNLFTPHRLQRVGLTVRAEQPTVFADLDFFAHG